MKRIGIVVPLPGELRSLTRTKMHTGTTMLLNPYVMIGLSGISTERAQAIGKCLLESGVTGLVSWGSAASLDETLLPGSLVLPKRIVTADCSTLEVDRYWHARLRHCLAETLTVHHQPMAHSSGLLSNSEQKQRLFASHQAVAADMESATLATLAEQYNVPFIAIRAISDSMEMNLPDSVGKSVDKHGQVQLFKVLARVALHPSKWPALLQLGHGFRAAQLTLAKVAQQAGLTLLGPTKVKRSRNVATATELQEGLNKSFLDFSDYANRKV